MAICADGLESSESMTIRSVYKDVGAHIRCKCSPPRIRQLNIENIHIELNHRIEPFVYLYENVQ